MEGTLAIYRQDKCSFSFGPYSVIVDFIGMKRDVITIIIVYNVPSKQSLGYGTAGCAKAEQPVFDVLS